MTPNEALKYGTYICMQRNQNHSRKFLKKIVPIDFTLPIKYTRVHTQAAQAKP